MPTPFYIFPDPIDAATLLTLDGGQIIQGVPGTHPSGRVGQVFQIPDGAPQGNGAALSIQAPGKVSINLRGVLWINSPMTGLMVDDFRLSDANVILPRIVASGTFVLQSE